MGRRSFIHYHKYAKPHEWLSLSGTHRQLPGIMPVIKRKPGQFGQDKICLHTHSGRCISVIKKPISVDHQLHGRVRDIIQAMHELEDLVICGECADSATKDHDDTFADTGKIYLNIQEYQKEQNPLTFLASGTVAFIPFSVIPAVSGAMTASRMAADLAGKIPRIARRLHMGKKIHLKISDTPSGSISFEITRKQITFSDLAELLQRIDSSGKKPTRAVIDYLQTFGIRTIYVASDFVTHALS